jgi:thiamine kinase-like enzyme
VTESTWQNVDKPRLQPEFNYSVSEYFSGVIVDKLPKKIRSRVKTNGHSVLKCMTDNESLIGRYRLHINNNESYFIRITERISGAEIENALTQYLFNNNAWVNEFISCGIELNCSSSNRELRMDVRPLLPKAHHYSGSKEELALLGRGMAAIHKLLKTFPLTNEIKTNSNKRIARLIKIRNQLEIAPSEIHIESKLLSSWVNKNTAWLKEMATEIDLSPIIDTGLEQCVHGEPHPANVLFTNSRAIFLDFEEAVQLFVNTDWDLSFLSQRFVLNYNLTSSEKKRQIDVLSESYGRNVYEPEISSKVAWMTILIILDLYFGKNIVTPLSELEKFKKMTNIDTCYF